MKQLTLKRIMGAVAAAVFLISSMPQIIGSISYDAAANTQSQVQGGEKQVSIKSPVYVSAAGLKSRTANVRTDSKQDRDWSKYSSDCFYDRLRSDNERQLYKGLREAAINAMNSGADINEIRVPYTGISENRVWDIEEIFYKNESQYFFLKFNGWSMYVTVGVKDPDYGTAFMRLDDRYISGSARQEGKQILENTIDTITQQTANADNAIEKEKIIHDALIKRLTYVEDETGYDNQGTASSLIDDRTVCAGYSAAFNVLMNGVGIPTISISAIKDQTHRWNEVCLDGNWYNVDITWDDPDYNESCSYKNFDVSDKAFQTGSDGKPVHTPSETFVSNGRPECPYDLARSEDYQSAFNEGIDGAEKAPGKEVVTLYYDKSGFVDENNYSHEKLFLLKTLLDSDENIIFVQKGSYANDDKDYNLAILFMPSELAENGLTVMKFDKNVIEQARKMAGGTLDYLVMYDELRGSDTNTVNDSVMVEVQMSALNSGEPLHLFRKDNPDDKLYSSQSAGEYAMTQLNDVDLYKNTLSLASDKNFYLCGDERAEYINNEIIKNTRPVKKTVTVKKGHTKYLKVNNISSVKYKSGYNSDENTAYCSFSGHDIKVKGIRKGSVTVKETLTFYNGDTKTVKFKVKVK